MLIEAFLVRLQSRLHRLLDRRLHLSLRKPEVSFHRQHRQRARHPRVLRPFLPRVLRLFRPLTLGQQGVRRRVPPLVELQPRVSPMRLQLQMRSGRSLSQLDLDLLLLHFKLEIDLE